MSGSPVTNIGSIFSSKVNEPQRLAKDGEEGNCCFCVSSTLGLALLIIGAVGAAGLMSGVSVGGCAVGLSIPMALASCCGGAANKGKSQASEILNNVIYAVVMTILGSLAIAGVIPPTTMGWCLVLPTLVKIALSCVINGCIGCIAVGAVTVLGIAARNTTSNR